MSFITPPTETKGSKNSSLPASIPIFLKIKAEPIAPADNTTVSECNISSFPFLINLTPFIRLSSIIKPVISASSMNSAPFSIAMSTKCFPVHFASTGHPNAH